MLLILLSMVSAVMQPKSVFNKTAAIYMEESRYKSNLQFLAEFLACFHLRAHAQSALMVV